jgi:hypothetical protein
MHVCRRILLLPDQSTRPSCFSVFLASADCPVCHALASCELSTVTDCITKSLQQLSSVLLAPYEILLLRCCIHSGACTIDAWYAFEGHGAGVCVCVCVCADGSIAVQSSVKLHAPGPVVLAACAHVSACLCCDADWVAWDVGVLDDGHVAFTDANLCQWTLDLGVCDTAITHATLSVSANMRVCAWCAVTDSASWQMIPTKKHTSLEE